MMIYLKLKRNKNRRWLLVLGMLCFFFLIGVNGFSSSFEPATPESQGFDSAALIEMLQTIQSDYYPHDIHEMIIIRNNKTILEQYMPPYDEGTLHSFKSVSKSITSLLVGIAISEGKLSLDTTVYEVFPEAFKEIADNRKKEITLRHLLTMTPGFDLTDDDLITEKSITSYLHSKEWIRNYMQLPLIYEPGESFKYFSPTTNLITAILTEKIGQDLKTYADEKLFHPLGIQTLYWQRGPNGYLRGAGGIYATLRDMSKIAMLLVNKGRYNEKQLIDYQWIKESTSNQIGAQMANYNTQKDGKYGYQWWVPDSENFMALGWGGQYIFAVPELNLVVVKTGSDFFKANLIGRYILPALKSYFWPLKDNPEAYQQLSNLSSSIENPNTVQAIIPDIVKNIMGKQYHCSNENGEEKLRFEINSSIHQNPVLTLYRTYTLKDGKEHTVQLNIGLDGLCRMSTINVKDLYFENNAKDFGEDIETLDIASKGTWISDKTLRIYSHQVGSVLYELWEITFHSSDRISVRIQYKPTSIQINMTGMTESTEN